MFAHLTRVSAIVGPAAVGEDRIELVVRISEHGGDIHGRSIVLPAVGDGGLEHIELLAVVVMYSNVP